MATSELVADCLSSWWIAPKWTELDGALLGTGVEEDGTILALRVDVGDLSVASFALGAYEQDDHDAGAHVAPDDQPPIWFYARHNQDSVVRYRVGTGAPGELALGAAQTITFAGATTYTQAWRRPGTDEVHLFARDDSRYWSNAYSSGWGTGWSSPRRVFDFGAGQLVYILTVPVAADPSVLRFAAYGHPTSSTIHDIRVGLIDLDTGAVTALDGTTLGNLKTGASLPIAFTSIPDLAWDAPAGHLTRLYDIGSGPAFTLALSDWDEDDPTSTYKLVTWSGSAWGGEDLVDSGVAFNDAGGRRYYGGMALPPAADGTLLYTAREDAGDWIVERWAKDGTWSADEIARDTDMLIRPMTVERGSSVRLLWHRATSYAADTDWSGSLWALQERARPSALAGSPSAWPSMRP